MRRRVLILAVWAVLLGSLLAAVAFVVHITSVTREGSRVVSAKAMPGLHLNAQGQLIQSNGSQVAYSKTLKGWVDGEVLGTDSVTVSGWAGDKVSGTPAKTIIVFVNGKFAAKASTGVQRDDVARQFNHPELSKSGFHIKVQSADLSAAKRDSDELRVFAFTAGGEAHELEYPKNLPLGHP